MTIQLADLRYDHSKGDAPFPPTPELAAAMEALTDDGDTFQLSDRESLRLRIAEDPYSSINDYDSDGSVEWTSNNDHGSVRPDHFTGTARIIQRDHNSALWWQPPGADIIGDIPWTAEQMRTEEARIRDLIENGFLIVTLELRETLRDLANGDHEVCVTRASVGGVDKFYPELISELVAEIVTTLEDD